MVEPEAQTGNGGRAASASPSRRLSRRRFWMAVAAGAALMVLFLPLMEYFFDEGARTTWPAYAIVLPLAAAAAAVIGRSLWVRAAGALAGGAGATFAVVAIFWFAMLSSVGHCGLAPDSAMWDGRPATLHVQLPDGGDYMGHRVTWSVPAPGMPMDDADLDARWGRWSLAAVSWGNDQGGFNHYPLTATPGAILGVYPDLASFQDKRGDVAAFLDGFGIDAAQAMRIADAMAANVTPSQVWGASEAPYLEFRAAIPDEWGPQTVWDSFCCIAESESAIGGLGQVQLIRGPWAFLFELEQKELHGDGFTLRSDADGRVEFHGLAMDSGSSKEYRQRVGEELGRLNLPQPADLDEVHLNGSIC